MSMVMSDNEEIVSENLYLITSELKNIESMILNISQGIKGQKEHIKLLESVQVNLKNCIRNLSPFRVLNMNQKEKDEFNFLHHLHGLVKSNECDLKKLKTTDLTELCIQLNIRAVIIKDKR
jgi:hypothetical protein